MMASLLYLKHAFNESDESVVERWGESPIWQMFSGEIYFEHRAPCDASLLSRFRRLMGEEGVEELLAQTVMAAVEMKVIDPKELESIIVDSTVQEKAVAHPTDSNLLETAREEQLPVKQTYEKEGKTLNRKIGRYAHATKQRSGSAKLNRSDKCIIGVLCCGKKAVEGDQYEQIIRATDTSRIQR